MALTVTHTTAADGTFSASGTTAWNATHTVTGSLAGDVIFADAPNSDFDLATTAPSAVTIITKSVTGIVAGDQIIFDVWCWFTNNSGAGRNIVFTASAGALSINPQLNFTASGTTKAPLRFNVIFSVSATNLSNVSISQLGTDAGISAGNSGNLALAFSKQGFNTTASDLTGTQTVSFTAASNNSTATQTLTLLAFTIRKVSTT